LIALRDSVGQGGINKDRLRHAAPANRPRTRRPGNPSASPPCSCAPRSATPVGPAPQLTLPRPCGVERPT